MLWVAFSFTLLASSATKFHHYVFPVLPGLGILLALFVERLWEEGISEHAVSLVFGFILFLLVGHDRPTTRRTSPTSSSTTTTGPTRWSSSPSPSPCSPRARSGWATCSRWCCWPWAPTSRWACFPEVGRLADRARDGVAVPRVGRGLPRAHGHERLGARHPPGGRGPAPRGRLGGRQASRAGAESRTGLWCFSVLLLMVGGGALARGVMAPASADGLLKPLSEPVNVKMALGFTFTVAGGLAVVACLLRSRVMLYGTFWALAAGFALWFNWGHWVDLSHHWTQRDLFWRYYAQRKPDEPIAAYLMNWRGETFYSRNTVKQIRETPKLRPFVEQPGREWALVEHNRLGLLRQNAGADKVVTVVDRDINNKFVLVTID
ncbi:hypothetical protein ACN28S_43075 [Cystobacter fuscus]